MVLPRLLHPVDCVIQQVNRAATAYDSNAREPIQSLARKTSVTVPGQVRWGRSLLQVQPHGSTSEDSGYVLFRYVDLEAVSVEIEINDRILIPSRRTPIEVYVTALEPVAHYTDQGGATMVKAYFSDRKPAKERRQ